MKHLIGFVLVCLLAYVGSECCDDMYQCGTICDNIGCTEDYCICMQECDINGSVISPTSINPLCYDSVECNGHGTCGETGCMCDSDYLGTYCDIVVDGECGDHGTPLYSDGCACEPGYAGSTCNTMTYPQYAYESMRNRPCSEDVIYNCWLGDYPIDVLFAPPTGPTPPTEPSVPHPGLSLPMECLVPSVYMDPSIKFLIAGDKMTRITRSIYRAQQELDDIYALVAYTDNPWNNNNPEQWESMQKFYSMDYGDTTTYQGGFVDSMPDGSMVFDLAPAISNNEPCDVVHQVNDNLYTTTVDIYTRLAMFSPDTMAAFRSRLGSDMVSVYRVDDNYVAPIPPRINYLVVQTVILSALGACAAFLVFIMLFIMGILCIRNMRKNTFAVIYTKRK